MRTTAATPSIPKLVGVFAVVTLGTVAVMVTDLLSPSVTQSGLQQNAVRLGVLAVLLYGSSLALTRARFSDRARLAIWSFIALPLLVWQSIVWWLAVGGVFEGQIGPLPLLPLAILLPLLIGLPILLSSRMVGRMLDATPPSWLVGVQVYRVFGSVFLTGWLAGNLSTIPAVPAGAGSARCHHAECAGESRRAADRARSRGGVPAGPHSRVRCAAVVIAAFPFASSASQSATHHKSLILARFIASGSGRSR